MAKPKFYWFRFSRNGGLPVTLPAMPEKSRKYRWTGLYGIQIGRWFFGAIQGDVDRGPPASSAEDPS